MEVDESRFNISLFLHGCPGVVSSLRLVISLLNTHSKVQPLMLHVFLGVAQSLLSAFLADYLNL